MLVELKRTATQPFGIGFKKTTKPPYCQVSKLSDGGAAMQNGKIHVGDLLLGINGRNVQHVEPEQLKELMTQYKNDLTLILEVRRVNFGTTENQVIMNGGTPTINVGHVSPDLPDSVSSTSSSPGQSPNAQRRGRRSGAPTPTLPDIEEGKPTELRVSASTDQKRHSFTSEVQRKSPEINRLKISKSSSLDLANLPQWRKSTSHMVNIQNLLDGSEMVDRLHNQEVKVRLLSL